MLRTRLGGEFLSKVCSASELWVGSLESSGADSENEDSRTGAAGE